MPKRIESSSMSRRGSLLFSKTAPSRLSSSKLKYAQEAKDWAPKAFMSQVFPVWRAPRRTSGFLPALSFQRISSCNRFLFMTKHNYSKACILRCTLLAVSGDRFAHFQQKSGDVLHVLSKNPEAFCTFLEKIVSDSLKTAGAGGGHRESGRVRKGDRGSVRPASSSSRRALRPFPARRPGSRITRCPERAGSEKAPEAGTSGRQAWTRAANRVLLSGKPWSRGWPER